MLLHFVSPQFDMSFLGGALKHRAKGMTLKNGAEVFSSFLNEDKVDKVILFMAPKIMGSGLSAFKGFAANRLDDVFQLDITDVRMVGTDILVTAYPRSYENRRSKIENRNRSSPPQAG